MLCAPDMPTSELRAIPLSKQKFSVAIPELPLLVGHYRFHPLLVLGSIRKRGSRGCMIRPDARELGGGDIWNRNIAEHADSA